MNERAKEAIGNARERLRSAGYPANPHKVDRLNPEALAEVVHDLIEALEEINEKGGIGPNGSRPNR